MKRIAGILVIVLVLYALVLSSDQGARTLNNHQNLAKRVALYGVLTLGAGILILAGGIDLSMGSVVCLAGITLGKLLSAPSGVTPNVFYLLAASIASGFVAAMTYSRVRDRLPWFLAVPLALLAWPAAPVALAILLFPSLRERLGSRIQNQPLCTGVAGLLALVAGAAIHLVPFGLGQMLEGQQGWLAILTVLLGGATIGLFHGLLVTRLRLQPFIVTLCGLFIWRGVGIWLALPDPMAPVRGVVRFLSFGYIFGDVPNRTDSVGTVVIQDLSERYRNLAELSNGLADVAGLTWFNSMPQRFWLLLALAAVLFVVLHLSVYGRYLFAVGANEQAARYAGIDADRYKIVSYVLCAMLATLGGILLALEVGSVQPFSTGQSYELYAITGAVLGGCSLRGGEGTVIGMLLGTAVLPLLNNLIVLSGLPGDLQFLIVGLALLLGTVLDELLKRRGATRRRV